MGRTSSIAAREKWREIVGRQRASGLSVAAFCRREGLATSSLFAWKRRLSSMPKAAAFVEARLTPPTSASRQASIIELRLRGRRVIRVRPGFDADLLGQLLRTLEALP